MGIFPREARVNSKGFRLLICRALGLALSCVLMFGAVGPVSAVGAVLRVKPKGMLCGWCGTWASACSLQRALTMAHPGDQIWVAKGTYKPTLALDPAAPRTKTFALQSGIALFGGFAGTETSLSQRNWKTNVTILSGDLGVAARAADNAYHVVTVARGVDATTALDGFTITAGNANGSAWPYDRGGGIYNDQSSPTVANLVIDGNAAGYAGGGVFNGGSATFNGFSPTFTNVIFKGNTAAYIGGGLYTSDASPTLTNVVFNGNSAGAAGGMYNSGGSSALTNVTFMGNSSQSDGGGLLDAGGGSTLANVTFSGNSADQGGGLFNGGNSTLANVTLNGNSAQKGGGMYNGGASLLTNVTFSGNSASEGGGIYNGWGVTPLIENSIFWGNGTEIVNDSLSSVTINHSIVQGGYPGGANIINADPQLGPLRNNGSFTQTMALQAGSPAIDAGDNATCAAYDQRGVPRPQGPACDLGAFEVATSASISSVAAQDGWVLESSETSNVGGILNAAATTLNLGDDRFRRQYRAILSFNTGGLPDNAVIVSAVLKLTRQSVVPATSNPFAIFRGLLIDVRKGFFGSSPRLQLADFRATGSKTVGPFQPVLVSGVYSLELPSTAYPYINTSAASNGLTQLRLRFKLDDNNNATANILRFFSANHQVESYRPLLVISYYVPVP